MSVFQGKDSLFNQQHFTFCHDIEYVMWKKPVIYDINFRLFLSLSIRARVEDTHIDSNPKVDGLSDFYDNDFEIKMEPTRPPQDRSTMAHKRQGRILPLLQVQ